MSNTSNFRVAINLSNFFHDHRNRARIFINNDIQTIRDLENRIENIFQITNFHLTSQNEFLPPTEDVRILQQNDIIWVMPNTYEQPIISSTRLIESNNAENKKNKKRSMSVTEKYVEESFHPSKKKKKEICEVTQSVHEETSNPSAEQSKKKKKHKKDHDANVTEDNIDITTEVEQIKHKEKKKKKKIHNNSSSMGMSDTLTKESFTQNENSTLKINTLLPKLQLHIDSYNKKIEKKNNLENSSSSSDTSRQTERPKSRSKVENTKEPYTCKGDLANYKKKVSVPTITDKYLQEKKVNIVKIEYLSGGPSDLNKTAEFSKSSTRSSVDNKSKSMIEASTITDNNEVQQNETSLMNFSTENNDTIGNIVFNNDDKIKRLINCDNSSPEFSGKIISDEIKTKNISDNMEIDEINNENLNKNVTKHLSNVNSNVSVKTTKFFETIESPVNKSHKSVIDNLNHSSKWDDQKPNTNIDAVINSNNNIRSANPTVAEVKIVSNYDADIIYNSPNISFKNRQSNTCLENLNISSIAEDENSEKTGGNDQILAENCELQPLQNNVEIELNSDNLEGKINDDLSDSKNINRQLTDESFVNNKMTANLETDVLNASFASESKAEVSVMDESTNISDINKNSEIQKDDSATLNKLSVSAASLECGSSHSRRKKISGVGQLLGDLRESESLVTGEIMDSDPSQEFVTKRRRKRVRKKRKKNNQEDDNSSLNDSSIIVTPKYIPKPMASKACPALHLKFEEDGDSLKAVNVTKEQSQDEENKESCMETSFIESITIESESETSSQNFFIKDDVILKSPSVKNSWPRVGDVIAFKFLRMTDDYTPEISSYITGKVLEYNSDSKTVYFDILSGLDQCKEPKGKLTTPLEDDHARKRNSTRREFFWSDIIDPRLLFP